MKIVLKYGENLVHVKFRIFVIIIFDCDISPWLRLYASQRCRWAIAAIMKGTQCCTGEIAFHSVISALATSKTFTFCAHMVTLI